MIHMKKTKSEFYLENLRKRLGAPVLIFCLAFMVYVFLGLCLTYDAAVFDSKDIFLAPTIIGPFWT